MSSDLQPEPQDGQPTEEQSAAEAEGPGVLGSLPRSRPSVRSPRRAEAAAKAAPAAKPQQSRGKPGEGASAGAGGASTAPGSPAEPARPAEADAGGAEADLERLARAGLSVAGGAAALGLRAAGRAAAALRDAVERR